MGELTYYILFAFAKFNEMSIFSEFIITLYVYKQLFVIGSDIFKYLLDSHN